jgi:hypothetical protein
MDFSSLTGQHHAAVGDHDGLGVFVRIKTDTTSLDSAYGRQGAEI